MSKYGTCAYCVHAGETRRQPHERVADVYLCILTDLCDAPAPPPVARVQQEVGFLIQGDDCDRCVHYQAAGKHFLAKVLTSRKRRLRLTRSMIKLAAAKVRSGNA